MLSLCLLPSTLCIVSLIFAADHCTAPFQPRARLFRRDLFLSRSATSAPPHPFSRPFDSIYLSLNSVHRARVQPLPGQRRSPGARAGTAQCRHLHLLILLVLTPHLKDVC